MATLNAAKRNSIGGDKFAFPKERKEPLENAAHVRNAIARFNQVEGVSDSERDAAWKRIRAAAKTHGVEVKEKGWREIGAERKSSSKAK
jgi:phage portal protein BeeE